MKRTIVILSLVCLPAAAIELQGDKVVMTPVERQRMSLCATQGGCYVVTRAALDAVVQMTIKVTLEEVGKSAPICRRDDTI